MLVVQSNEPVAMVHNPRAVVQLGLIARPRKGVAHEPMAMVHELRVTAHEPRAMAHELVLMAEPRARAMVHLMPRPKVKPMPTRAQPTPRPMAKPTTVMS